MNASEVKTLKVGDRVRWIEDSALGTVREIGYLALKIEWDDHKWLMLYYDNNEPMCNKVEVAQ